MGVFEQFPYANMHEMNLEWLLKKMKELDKAMETFKATESLKFADPIIWDIATQYEKSTIVLDPTGNAYLSLQPVPTGVQLNNDDYWLEIFNFTDYTRTANQNLTINTETNTTRASAPYQVDAWLIWNDVLYRVTSPIAIDDALIVAPAAGSNIVHFTVEDFLKAFITYATGLINQYKNDIDASELAYRQQLAQDISDTTASLQAQLNAAIAGATVDSEVINARVGADGVTYATLGDAIREQLKKKADKGYKSGSEVTSTLTSNYLKGRNNTDYAASGFGEYITAAVSADTVYLISGVTYGSSTYPLCVYYDSSDNVIGYYEPFVASTNYENLAVRTPLNCTKIVVNGSQTRIHAAIYDAIEVTIDDLIRDKADKGYKSGNIVASTLTSNYLKGRDNTDYAASDFGEYITAFVSADTVYLISGVTYGSSNYPLCIYYDRSDNVIGYYEPFVASTNYENLAVRTPLNCTKIVVNGSQTRIHAAIYDAIEVTINDLIGYKADKGYIPAAEVTSVLTLDKVVSTTDSEFSASGWGEYITATVTENTPYLISGSTFGANNYSLCNFYHDNTLLGYMPVVTNTQYHMLQIMTPPTCNRIIVNGSQTTVGAAIYSIGKEITVNDVVNSIKRPLHFGCVGDSITVESGNTKQWPSYVCDILGSLDKHNVAFGAGTYAWRAVTYNGVTYYPQDYTDPDFAGYFGGIITSADEAQKTANNCSKCIVEQFIAEVNDGLYPAPEIFVFAYGSNDDFDIIGSVEEAFSDTLENIDKYKTAGAMRYAIQAIQNAFPKCKVFVLSTLQTVYGTHERHIIKNGVMKGVADYLSCSFIDQYNNSGISSIYERAGQAGRFLQDGLHPNNAGRKRQASYIAPQILSDYIPVL